jgi:hypothetical protein
VDTHRQVELSRHPDLATKLALLHVPWGVIVVIIETDLPPGDDAVRLRRTGEAHQHFVILRRGMLGLVRMDAHRGEHPPIPLRQRHRTLTASSIHAEGQDRRDARLPGARNDGVAVRIEVWHVEVSVGIDEHGHFT